MGEILLPLGSILFGLLGIWRRKATIREANGYRSWLSVEYQERMFIVVGSLFVVVGIGDLAVTLWRLV